MTAVKIDDKYKDEAKQCFPDEPLDKVVEDALKSHLAYAELAKMKGFLTKDDLWDMSETR
jgi:hypothetical protein